jgi:hypothetical protein
MGRGRENAKMRETPISTSSLFFYTEAGKTIGFTLEQPLHVVALPCSALQIFSVYFKTASAYILFFFLPFRVFSRFFRAFSRSLSPPFYVSSASMKKFTILFTILLIDN